MPGVFSIGYQGKGLEVFRNRLVENHVSMVVDVRNHAFSMKKGFSKKPLTECLKKEKIGYLHIRELGIESYKRKNLDEEGARERLFADYRKELQNKKEFVQQIVELGKTKRIALLCFEANPKDCHRGVLSQELEKQGLAVLHL